MIEIPRQGIRSAAQVDQAGDRCGVEERADRVYPQAAVLVHLRIEFQRAGAHAGKGAERDPLVRLISEQPVTADDLGALGIGNIELHELVASAQRV